ncbi:MAG: (d)CMP kinase [Anaerolineaceae bacterium]|nr:(d)CMP kinase [Anaerolineaceae bacterium]
MMLPTKIAIDGPAASGKSTLAEKLAEYINYMYFDTGVMYRAVTWAALQRLGAVDDEAAVSELAEKVQIDVRPPSEKDGRKNDVFLDGMDVSWEIRTPEVNQDVSEVSTYQGVRRAMTEQQRRIGERGSMVMVGRDIGTVVLPDADLKIYLDASAEERAKRRYQELVGRDMKASYEEILLSVVRRDNIDSTRAIAPLRPADDAIIVDTDGKSIEDVFEEVKMLLK